MQKYRGSYSRILMLPLSNANIPETSHHCSLYHAVYIIASHVFIVGSRKTSLVDVDPDRPRKTGSRYNDSYTLSCFGKPKESVTVSQKITVLFHCLLGDFLLKLHWGYFYPLPLPVAGKRVKQ